MTSLFGPAPLKTLTVSPIPGTFGQGFPGLVYLSTLSYLEPRNLPPAMRQETTRLFYSELLHAHEVAHQWWGNTVTSASAHDEWLMEALASYSALLVLEKRKGRRPLDHVLGEYKDHLLASAGEDHTVESAGPIVWGGRLVSSQTPTAWRVITYEKGSWIIHMLRAQLGDERFFRLLAELVNRYRYKPLSTEQFRALAAELAPPKFADPGFQLFFDQWVYATGIPELKFSHTVRGKAPAVRIRGTVRQSGVPEDFSTLVPVEVQLPGRRTVVQWLRTAIDPVSFSADVRSAPLKVALDPGGHVLRK
jgi:aminopeptidase N